MSPHNTSNRAVLTATTAPRTISRSVVAVLVLVAMAVAFFAGRAQLGEERVLLDGSGTLTVDGIVYDFTPTTCQIGDDDFVAAGTGFRDDEQFWVSASSVGLDLAVGTQSEVEEPAADQLWLISEDGLVWERTTGDTITAEVDMTDRRSAPSTTVHGSLELHCSAADV